MLLYSHHVSQYVITALWYFQESSSHPQLLMLSPDTDDKFHIPPSVLLLLSLPWIGSKHIFLCACGLEWRKSFRRFCLKPKVNRLCVHLAEIFHHAWQCQEPCGWKRLDSPSPSIILHVLLVQNLSHNCFFFQKCTPWDIRLFSSYYWRRSFGLRWTDTEALSDTFYFSFTNQPVCTAVLGTS